MTTGPVLITGGAGFIGSNLADRLASQGQEVLVLDNLSRPGVDANLDWLKRRHPRLVSSVIADIRDFATVERAARDAVAVFHFAAQVAVTTSMVDPMDDFEINVHGTVRLLDALRRRPDPAPLIFASTNKVYGDLADVPLRLGNEAWRPTNLYLRDHGVSEDRTIAFHTPYGCSKGAADQYVLDWARSYGVPTAVLRMSCVYGTRQRGNEDQGWVAHFLLRALRGEPVSIFGDGHQVRDILFVDDAVDAYVAAWDRIGDIAGTAFNLGGGPRNAVSLLQVLGCIERVTGRRVDLRFQDWRPGDQRWFVADIARATVALGLATPLHWEAGIARLAEWCAAEGVARAVEPAQ